MTPRKQITSQRRAKQAAKKHSAERKNPGKSASRAKAPANVAGNTRGLKPPSASQSQLVEIEKPVYGGAFLAHLEGKAVFVPLTLPGEQARVRITQSRSSHATAEAEEILRPAPERIAPVCPHFGACGGCHYQHTDYATQLAFKQAILRETLLRGGVAIPAEIAVLSGEQWGYRNRIRLAFDAAGNPGYRGRRSHAVVPIRECRIAAPLLIQAAQIFAELARNISPSLRPTEIALFCNSDETALLASVITANPSKQHFDELACALHERIPALSGMELIVEGLDQEPNTVTQWSATSLAYRAAGFDYRVDHGAFFQVNRWLIDPFVERVVGNHQGKLAWDLFAGVGLFARQLTKSFARVVAVESAPSATGALEENLRGTNSEAVQAETLVFLRRDRTGEKPYLIVADPPRTGLGAESCALLAEIAAPVLVCVSCDPATLARDLRILTISGYKIQSLTLADLFPQTFHLETVVHLRRA